MWNPWGQTLDLIKIVGIVGGLVLTGAGFCLNAFATLRNITSRRLLNYQELTKSHRDLWKLALDKPDVYGRVLNNNVNLKEDPISDAERRFINLLLLHITTAHEFSKKNDLIKIEQLERDVDEVLSLPIPRQVWLESRHLFNKAFIAFVEGRRKRGGTRTNPRPWSFSKQWNILVLTGFKQELVEILSRNGDRLIFPADMRIPISVDYIESNDVDIIISFGYGLILSRQVLDQVTAINIHPGLLPENRGPNPHLWSALGYSRRGVTIHYMDKGVDTGDIIARRELGQPDDEISFKESFEQLIRDCTSYFIPVWVDIRAGRNRRQPQRRGGRTRTFRDQSVLRPLFGDDGLDMKLSVFRNHALRLMADEIERS